MAKITFMEMLLRKKLKKLSFEIRKTSSPKPVLNILHDNAPAHKAPIVTGYFEEERISSSFLSQPPDFSKFPLSTSFFSSNFKITQDKKHKMPLYLQFISIWWVSLLRNMKNVSRSGLYPGQG